MKSTKTVIAAAVLGLSFVSTANAGNKNFVAADNSTPSQLCVVAAEGTRIAMHREIKGSGWSKTFIQNNIQCNGQSIGTFAAKYGSEGVQKLLPAGPRVNITDLAQVKHLNGYVHVSK